MLTIKVRLFGHNYTIFHLSCGYFSICDVHTSKELRLDSNFVLLGLDKIQEGNIRKCKLKRNALFLLPFAQACSRSPVYRNKVLQNFCGSVPSDTVCIKLMLEPPDQEIIDYAWNERMLYLLWTRVEIENAFSWLSTLGGAYSALGDYFDYCAEEAGRISQRQYRLSKMLGDESLAARSKLYFALSYSQKGQLKLARHIVRNVAEFARTSKDKRLLRMCQGVWAKLKYLRALKNGTFHILSYKCDGDVGSNGKCV